MLETTNQIIYSQIPYIGFFVSDPYSAIPNIPVKDHHATIHQSKLQMDQSAGECLSQHGLVKIAVAKLLQRPIPGWWYTYPFEKYEFVSWDDDIPNMEK